MSKATKRTPAPTGPIRVVICGEVGAGKSTVLNALARDGLLRDNLGADNRPVIVLGSGEPSGMRIVHSDGREELRTEVALPADLRAIARIEMCTRSPHLAGIELIEVPMTSAEEITPLQRDLVRSGDILIWVTIGSQAWRLTERNILEALGDSLPSTALLAVTRADKLRNTADRDKVRARLERETDAWFEELAFVSAARRDVERSGRSKEAWQRTGGTALMDTIRKLSDRIQSSPTYAPKPSAFAPMAAVAAVQAVDADHRTDIPDTGLLVLRDSDRESATEVRVPADGVFADRIARLQQVSVDLADALAIGLVPTDKDCVAIAGGEDICRRVGQAAHEAFATLSAAYDPHDEAGAVSACTLSMTTCRLIFQDVPGIGLVFLYAENQRLNLGTLQAGLSRLCRACLEPSVAVAA